MAGDADLLLLGGRIFTAASSRAWASAMAIRGDRLLAVGTDAQAERWSGRKSRRIDLRGRVVVPGFVDAHTHLADAAAELGWTRLEHARSLNAAVDALRRAAADTPPGAWVLGTGWDEAKWPERRYPTREDLDRASTRHPVVARRVDCHMAVLNTMALARAEALRGTRGFEVDTAGRTTGVLKEDAFVAFAASYAAGEDGVRRGLERIAGRAHRLGITSIHDVVDLAAWRAYQAARRAGRLRLRVYAMPRDALLPAFAASGTATGLGDAWLRLGAIKVFSDGSLGAYTAALGQDYAGRPGDRGVLVHTRAELREILGSAHRAGFQTATHALGDEAIRQVVEALEDVQAVSPRKDARHRIEHYELPDDDVLRRTRAAGIVVCAQPNFVGQWSGPGDVYATRLGRDRASKNNPYRQILRRGIPLCFGSDGMPYGPLYGVHWAVNGFFEDQHISPEEAVRAYTAGGAYASFEERTKGSLEAGKLADFVVLAGDPFAEPDRIRRCRIASTWLGGVCVYSARTRR
ncbi:MAG TPA: amidohydrolase [Thermoplasmata archaeon]|nr:amidohydrolase [Thermoplasmata archaeon]